MRKRAIIELSTLIGIALTTIGVIAAIMLSSYYGWYDEFLKVQASNVKPAKRILQTIDAELAEGIVYYNNNLAAVNNEDLIVTAHYTQGDETEDVVVEPDKYEVSVPADFASQGGTVTVTYKKKTATLDIDLVEVTLVELRLARAPNTTHYQTGSVFSDSGLTIYAVYNDGSEKLVAASDYVVDKSTALASGETKRTLSYNDNGVIKTIDIPITVSDTLDNGAVVSIAAVETCYANVGTNVTAVRPQLLATYESGNKLPLTASDYTIGNASETLTLGKAYTLDITYRADTSIKASIPVVVRNHLEAENLTIVGGSKNSEDSYTFENGVFTKTGQKPSFAGAFSQAVLKGEEASLATTVSSASGTTANITMCCGNSYLIKDDDGYFWMQPLRINTILDLLINDQPVQIPDSVVLKGCGPSMTNESKSSNYAPLYGVYYTFTFTDIPFKPGDNTVKFVFKESTVGARTCWSESPSTMNIDWIDIDMVGNVIPASPTYLGFNIIDETCKLEAGKPLTSATVSVSAIIEGNVEISISESMYNVSVEAVEPEYRGYDIILGIDYNVTVSLKSDPTINTTKVIAGKGTVFDVLTADIVERSGRVIWVFTGRSFGYGKDDLEFFDGPTDFEFDISFGSNLSFVLEIDVTDLTVPKVYPHMRLKGQNYPNDGNKNGDIRDHGLTFTNNKSVTVGNKKYSIKKEYSMPVLNITDTAAA